MPEPKTIQLEPQTILELEKLALQLKLADAEEKLAVIQLRDARLKLSEARRASVRYNSSLLDRLELPPNASLRLVDRENGTAEVLGD